MATRVCVIGLDSLTPQLALHAWWADLPHLRQLAERGFATTLASCFPPITVPAWPVMCSGADPGTLGIYGFHDRASRPYATGALHSFLSWQALPVWSILSRAGRTCRVIGVPLTYPPKPLRGAMVAGGPLPTATTLSSMTYPADLSDEVQRLSGGYIDDISDFRHLPADTLRAQIYAMTHSRFALARAWLAREDWNFFMMVDMGADRLQHRFWEAAAHPTGRPTALDCQSTIIRDYYRFLDGQIGSLLHLLRPDDTVLVVSDHGAQAMQGAIKLNEWLLQQGYLVLKQARPELLPWPSLPIDWSRTRAFADGGYVGRIYLNISGREPHGVLSSHGGHDLLCTLRQELTHITGRDRKKLHTITWTPAEIYTATRGAPPDLMVAFDNFAYRCLGTLGDGQICVEQTDNGFDGANHAHHGVLIMADKHGKREPPSACTLYDIAPTILHALGVPVPATMHGRTLATPVAGPDPCQPTPKTRAHVNLFPGHSVP